MEKQNKLEVVLKYFDDFTETQLSQLEALDALYNEWNGKINVISRKDIDALYEKHVLHSLAIAAICPFDDGARILDIGTGGGFPGIPLAILFPECQFVLADSIGKKIKVVQEVATAIGLKNVIAIHTRAEELKGKYTFDYAVSRAVAPLADLWRWGSPLITRGQKSDELPNGLVCLKGGDLKAEIAETGMHRIVQAWSVHDIFPEPSFEEKFVVYVPKLN